VCLLALCPASGLLQVLGGSPGVDRLHLVRKLLLLAAWIGDGPERQAGGVHMHRFFLFLFLHSRGQPYLIGYDYLIKAQQRPQIPIALQLVEHCILLRMCFPGSRKPHPHAPTSLQEFVQHCILPRMLNSPSDALYCATFLRAIHRLDVPGFSLLTVMQQVRACFPSFSFLSFFSALSFLSFL
jgi:hypothetical protein